MFNFLKIFLLRAIENVILKPLYFRNGAGSDQLITLRGVQHFTITYRLPVGPRAGGRSRLGLCK